MYYTFAKRNEVIIAHTWNLACILFLNISLRAPSGMGKKTLRWSVSIIAVIDLNHRNVSIDFSQCFFTSFISHYYITPRISTFSFSIGYIISFANYINATSLIVFVSNGYGGNKAETPLPEFAFKNMQG